MKRIFLIVLITFCAASGIWSAAPAIAEPERTERVWQLGRVHDQGSFGSCVGAAWMAWIEGAPDAEIGPGVLALYYRATLLDDMPDNDYSPDKGTWLWAGAEAVAEYGLIGSVRYTKDVNEARDWLLNYGPVVMSSPWYDSELAPDDYATVDGRIRGWHAYLCQGYLSNASKDGFKCRNSWGADWGEGGDFYWHERDLRYMAAHGMVEFALATKPLGLPFGALIVRAWAI